MLERLGTTQYWYRRRLDSLATALLHSWIYAGESPAGFGSLVDALTHPDLTLRFDVASALARLGTPQAMHALVDALDLGHESAEIAAAALAHFPERHSLDALIAAVDDRSGLAEPVRLAAIRSLGRIGGPDALGMLRWVLEAGSRWRRRALRPLRIEAARGIGMIGGEAAHEVLSRNAGRGARAVRRACRGVLDQLGGREP